MKQPYYTWYDEWTIDDLDDEIEEGSDEYEYKDE